jgi:hypothetical protein
MQNVVDGQATALIELEPSISTVVHEDGPVGVVEMSALPPLSTATQRLVDGHDTAARLFWSVSEVGVQSGAAGELGVGELRGLDVAEWVGVGDAAPHATAARASGTSNARRGVTRRL